MPWKKRGQEGNKNQEGQGSGGNGPTVEDEIRQIIRSELQSIIEGRDQGDDSSRSRQRRSQLVRPTKLGRQQKSGNRQVKDTGIKRDVELLTQVQMELSQELTENLKQLRAVIAESQRIAQRIQAVLGQDNNQQSE